MIKRSVRMRRTRTRVALFISLRRNSKSRWRSRQIFITSLSSVCDIASCINNIEEFARQQRIYVLLPKCEIAAAVRSRSCILQSEVTSQLHSQAVGPEIIVGKYMNTYKAPTLYEAVRHLRHSQVDTCGCVS